MIEQLFGFPVYRTNLSEENYNRKKIISVIEQNYKKDKTRNNWDNNLLKNSNIHHSYDDENNKIFKTPDYSLLLPVYNKHILKYLSSFKFLKTPKFNFTIVNYTCMTKGQYMINHLHPDSDFSAVHYIKFDEDKNDSTLFENDLSFSKFLSLLRPKLIKNFDNSLLINSWMYEYFKFNTKENDFVIFPSFLKHSIPEIKTEKTRITIAVNINIDNE